MTKKMPLDGIRVLDLGWRAVAPVTARMLGWGGAEVIRIESATRHDGARQMPPLTPGVEDSLDASEWFNNFNSNKLSVSLNLRHPRAKELALALASLCDIVVENFSAGTIDRMGLGYETLKKLRPDIIMVSHTLTGLDGPWKHVKGHGPMAAAMAGLHHLSGHEDTPPISPAQAFTDYVVNPHHSVFAILSALHYRRRTGRGQYIDLSQYESIAHTTGTSILEYTTLGRDRERTGNRSSYAAPQNVYPCRSIPLDGRTEDRWCAISVSSDEEWRRLCDAIDRPELADDERFESFEGRKKHEEEIDCVISAWTSDQFAEDVMVRLQAVSVGAGVVQNAKDLLTSDPQMAFSGHYRKVVHAVTGDSTYDGPPFTLSECPLEVRPGPLLGEHNDYILRELLGVTEEEINDGYVENYIA
ncbi:MAG: CoA transferase [Chloroflexi bacterium]|nr:CoA transferase [Chloroflexota bacterium]